MVLSGTPIYKRPRKDIAVFLTTSGLREYKAPVSMKINTGNISNNIDGSAVEELTRKDSIKMNAPARRAGITKGKAPDALVKPKNS
jgi:hypothetical protein